MKNCRFICIKIIDSNVKSLVTTSCILCIYCLVLSGTHSTILRSLCLWREVYINPTNGLFIFTTDYNSSRRWLVCDVRTGKESRNQTVQHFRSGSVPVHGGGGDVCAAEGSDWAALRRGDRRLGQLTGRHTWRFFYTIDTKVVSLVSRLLCLIINNEQTSG